MKFSPLKNIWIGPIVANQGLILHVFHNFPPKSAKFLISVTSLTFCKYRNRKVPFRYSIYYFAECPVEYLYSAFNSTVWPHRLNSTICWLDPTMFVSASYESFSFGILKFTQAENGAEKREWAESAVPNSIFAVPVTKTASAWNGIASFISGVFKCRSAGLQILMQSISANSFYFILQKISDVFLSRYHYLGSASHGDRSGIWNVSEI